ncbi:signal peptidase I [Desulforudis sp. 1088]|uniref:signal peptidase I n=1 Tax=unclassified Candidatus Desulforudis TaxID=2635950 RepID=UPI003CE4AB64
MFKVDRQRGSVLGELFESLAIAVVLAVIIRLFIFQPFFIPSGSMEPTLMTGDRIIVSKFSYHFSEPKRGDVIVFKYPKDPKRAFVKRVIGLPGETVQLKDSKLIVNGRVVTEDYLPPGLEFSDFGPQTVPRDMLFVLGDNRNNSDDSRVWGYLPRGNLIGKAVFVYWPLTQIGLVR